MDSSEYESGITKAEGKTNSLKGTITKLGIGAVVAKIGKAALDVGMDFETSMSQVAATMGISSEAIQKGDKNFQKLSESAKEMGVKTKFSASQSAEALNYLALAGYDTDKAIATLPTVLTLASAGGLELAHASDMMTDAMSALGIETKYASKFVDEMTVTSQKSNTSIGELGEAMLTVGGTAKILKGGTTELNTALGILADSGIKGAEGGTALRNVILSLTSPTDKASKLMKDLGIQVFDAKGEMLPMQDILGNMDETLGHMTEEEKQKALSTIFNKNDLKSVNALLADSGDRWSELSKQIDNSRGAGEKAASTMNDNLKGRLSELNSALEGVGIALYEKFEAPLKKVVEWGTKGFQKLAKAFEDGKLDVYINLISGALSGILTYLALFKAYKIATSVISIGKAIFNAVTMVKTLSNAVSIFNAVLAMSPIGAVATAIIAGIALIVGAFVFCWNHFEGFRNFWINAWNNIKETTSKIGEWLSNFFTETLPNAVDKFISFFTETIPQFIKNAIQWFSELPTKIWEFLVETYLKTIQWRDDMLQKAKELGMEFLNNIIDWFKQLPGKIWSWLVNSYQKSVEWKNNMVQKAKDLGSEFVGNIIDWFKQLPGKVWQWFTNIIQKVIQFKNDMIQKAKDTGREFGKWLQDSLKDLPNKMSEIGKNIVQGVWNGIKNMGSWFKNSISNFFGGMVDSVKSTLGIHSPSRVFRDEVGQWIPKGVEVGIDKEMPKLRSSVEDNFSNLSNIDIKSPEMEMNSRQEDFLNKFRNIKIEIPLQVDGREFTRIAVAPFQNELQEYNEVHNLKYSYR